jgi:hypothetical protein
MSERGSETLGTRLDKAGGFDQADARRVILAEVLSGRRNAGPIETSGAGAGAKLRQLTYPQGAWLGSIQITL